MCHLVTIFQGFCHLIAIFSAPLSPQVLEAVRFRPPKPASVLIEEEEAEAAAAVVAAAAAAEAAANGEETETVAAATAPPTDALFEVGPTLTLSDPAGR